MKKLFSFLFLIVLGFAILPILSFSQVRATIGTIGLTSITGPDENNQYLASGTWQPTGNQCWVPGESEFHYYINVIDQTDNDRILTTINPAACNGDFTDPVEGTDRDNGGLWPAPGQSEIPFSLTSGTHTICAQLLHVRPTGNDIAENLPCIQFTTVAHLTIIKTVTNDNGGTAVASNWTVSATGPITISGSSGSTSVTNAEVNPGTYSLSESGGPSGYAPGDWNCVKNNVSETGNSITLVGGDVATCTINNDDIQPKLTLIKHVTNDNGGKLEVSDFPLFVGGTGVTSGVKNGFNAGNYSVSETNQTGYAPSDWSNNCAADGSITLGVGDDKTCEITNDDIPGHLKIIKNTVGGDGTFNFTVSGPTSSTPSILTSSGTGNTEFTVNAGGYSVAEGTLSGWDLTNATCDSGTPASFTVPLDKTVTCTFENTKQGKITIIKDAKPNDCQDFAFSFTGKSSFYLDDDAGVAECEGVDRDQSMTFINLPVNTSYTVAETLPNAFWEYGGTSCINTGDETVYDGTTNITNSVSISLNPGADVTCTFVNNKKGPTRTLGFWKNHTAYTTSIFKKYFTGGKQIEVASHRSSITNTQSVGQSQLFGAYYSSIPKKSDGKTKRSEIDQARIQLLHQLITAKLNCAAFDCSTSIQNIIKNADSAYANGPKESILNFAGVLDVYNNSGDTIIITGTPGKATPKDSQSIANKVFWDTP